MPRRVCCAPFNLVSRRFQGIVSGQFFLAAYKIPQDPSCTTLPADFSNHPYTKREQRNKPPRLQSAMVATDSEVHFPSCFHATRIVTVHKIQMPTRLRMLCMLSRPNRNDDDDKTRARRKYSRTARRYLQAGHSDPPTQPEGPPNQDPP